jgi:hypothetical protein
MVITGWVLLVVAALMFTVGWVLNMNTPVQQPLPAIGVVIGLVAIGFLLVGYF